MFGIEKQALKGALPHGGAKGAGMQGEKVAFTARGLSLVKHVVDFNIRVKQSWAIAAQVQAVQNEILKRLLQLCLSNQHCPHHAAIV